MDTHTRQIIALAWSRMLGLADEALAEAASSPGPAAGRTRLEVPTDGTGPTSSPGPPPERPGAAHAHRDTGQDTQVATFVRLYGASVLSAPAWLLQAAREVDDEVLALEATLIRLGAAHRGRSLGEAALYYAEEAPGLERSGTVAVSDAREDAARLEALCPADDVGEAGLSRLHATFTLIPDDGAGHPTGDPAAGAGYEEWQGLIAQLGVLVRPDVRRLGVGTYAAAVATQEAFAAGLVPQWRARMGHTGSQRMADALGFELAGSQTTVLLGP